MKRYSKKQFKSKLNAAYCKDCVLAMRKIPDNVIDLTVTSPPYDNLRDYEGYTFSFKKIARELYRITKEGGVIVWVVADQTAGGSETGTSFKQALYFKEIGFNIHDTMIWSKPGYSSVGALNVRYPQTFEYMFVFSKGKVNTFNRIRDRRLKNPNATVGGTIRQKDGSMKPMSNQGKRCSKDGFGIRFNVWKMNPVISSKERMHPAQFPETLARDHIRSWSNEFDIILDPMCGSGTTLKMAKILKRNFIGFDISEEYIKLVKERLKSIPDIGCRLV